MKEVVMNNDAEATDGAHDHLAVTLF